MNIVPLILLAGTLAQLSQSQGGEAAAPSPKLRLVLKPAVTVQTPFITTGDVADLPSDAYSLRAAAAGVFLGLAPENGAVRIIKREEILAQLKAAGIPVEKVGLEGSETSVRHQEEDRTTSRPAVEKKPAMRSPPAGSSRKSSPATRSESEETAPKPQWTLQEGEVVVFKIDRGVVQIEEPVKVLSPGNAGDLIAVKNIRTGRDLTARVVDSHTVGPAPSADGPPVKERKTLKSADPARNKK